MGTTAFIKGLQLLLPGIFCLLLSAPVWAETQKLTLPQVIEYSLQNNGAIKSFRAEKGIRDAGKTKAGLLPNPTLELAGGTGALTGSSGENNLSVGISQEFFLAGKREKRLAIAEWELEMYRWQLVDKERMLREEVKTVFYDIRAPIDGVITEKQAVVGELSDPSKNLYTVADLSTAWVLVDINENDLAMVHKGQEAIVTVGAFPDLKLKGRIAYIADLVNEATRTVKARVEVANPDRKLKPEMFAAVELALQSDMPPVLAVPEEALQELEGRKVLFVTENGTEFAPRKVELGRASGGMTEVLSGLKESDRYAVKGSFLLKSELKKSEFGEG